MSISTLAARRWGCPAIAAALLVLCTPGPAHAGVSPQDGYGPDGRYQIHVEITPYLWLPATSADVRLGRGAAVSINAGVPSLSQIANVLTGAFTADGLLRYGPWSAELNIDYVAAAQDKALPTGPFGVMRSLKVDVSTVRVAPGLGYQVFNGTVAGIPATFDARAGFSYFTASSTLTLDRNGPLGRERVTGIDQSGSFTQPWLGLRGAIYPWPRWRFQLAALGQGWGVGGGTWGWQVSANATWAATNWLNLNLGFAALDESGTLASDRAVKSTHVTLYGPVFGVSFTF